MIIPGRAVAALEAVLVPERLLEGCSSPSDPMPSIVVTSAPSACTASTVQLFTASPFRWHCARAAVRGVAADMRPGQPELVAKEVDEQQARLHLVSRGSPLTVISTGTLALSASPSSSVPAPL